MKILHVTFADSGGGAARAAYRLHRAERAAGLESEMLVMRQGTTDPHVRSIGEWFVGRNRIAGHLQHRLLRAAAVDPRVDRALNLFPSRLHARINASDADVVNLHWIGEEMISIAEVARIRKPIVWTLHDAWACCGAEHYPAAADLRYERGYGRWSPARALDLDRWTWARKRRRWRNTGMHFVAPSQWMAGVCRQSALFRDRPVQVIPNPIDPAEFRPRDRIDARRRFGLPADRPLLLFGAQDVTHPRKGFAMLQQALDLCARDMDSAAAELVVFGAGELPAMPVPTRHLGWVGDDLDLLYSAADAFLAPSQIDNLPNTVAEATACGVPTVAFRIGGLPDLVTHKTSGYLAEPFDAADFAAGIHWVLAQDRAALAAAAAEQARALAPDQVVTAYVATYRTAIVAHRRRVKAPAFERLGSEYGGWIVPTDLIAPGAVCYSIGVGEDITFDLALIERFGADVFAYDPTPRAVTFLARLATPPHFHFAPVGVWHVDQVMRFYAPADPAHVSHSVVNIQGTAGYFEAPCRRLSRLAADNGHAAIDLLKLDVEGAEYRVIDSLIEDRVAVRVLCVEFHRLADTGAGAFGSQVDDTVRRLRRAGFRVARVERGHHYTFVHREAGA